LGSWSRIALRSNGTTRPSARAMAWKRVSWVRLEMMALLISRRVR
jgi:hypothetical protein